MSYKFSGLILEDPQSQNAAASPTKPERYIYYAFDIQEPDMVISKISVSSGKERITQQAVFLVTQSQYYVQTLRNGRKEDPVIFDIHNAEPWIDKLTTFFRDISSDPASNNSDVVPTGCKWLPFIHKGKDFASALANVFTNDLSVTLIRKNLYKFSNTERSYRTYLTQVSWDTERLPFVMEEAAKLTSEDAVRRTIANWNQNGYWRDNCSPQLDSLKTFLQDMYDRYHRNDDCKSFMQFMEERYGKSGIRDFLTSYLGVINPYYDTNNYYNSNSSPNIFRKSDDVYPERIFDLQRLTEYLTYEPIRQGFSSVSNFLEIWNDTLGMEELMYGKIKDKYPENLSSIHNILAAKTAIKKYQIDEKKFALHADAEKAYRWAPDNAKYLITSPETSSDILDEATQQQNCLSSYVKPFANNTTDIYFMRLQNDAEKSLVTIEVYEGRIRQAFRAQNKKISAEESAFLHKWADKFNLDASSISGAPLTAPARRESGL